MLQVFILHHYTYGDNSVILKLLSLEQGVISVLAKGIKTRSRLRTFIRPFAPLLIEIGGRGSLATLKSLEASSRAFVLQGKALYSGLYLNELLLQVLPVEEPHALVYEYYQQALAQLEQEILEPALRSFELKLLMELGYMPSLQEDDQQQAIAVDAWYRLVPNELPVRVAAFQSKSDATVWQGIDLLRIAAEDWSLPSTLQAAKRLTRQWIHYYTQGRVMRSRALFTDATDAQ